MRRVQREDRAAELLAAATELCPTRGHAGTAMADISAAAGVARGDVYGYYSSKDDMFAAVMDGVLRHEIQALDSELRDRDPLTAPTRRLADMRTPPVFQALSGCRRRGDQPARARRQQAVTWGGRRESATRRSTEPFGRDTRQRNVGHQFAADQFARPRSSAR
ncbi:TetR/AcrR family transcriptional regulator [Streptomyces sp. NPDC050509]|uniref:TetR/AcrR family transcriptional regulator n=1 Tax=Streptomyces sp. NPDC050509 TaxID=3365620 RepID=UPI003793074B